VPDAVLSEDTPVHAHPDTTNKLYFVFRISKLREVDWGMMRLRCTCFTANVTRCTQ